MVFNTKLTVGAGMEKEFLGGERSYSSRENPHREKELSLGISPLLPR